MRLTGLDLKMEQYAAGERFADHVIRVRDRAFLNRVWNAPEMLPTLDEIRSSGRLRIAGRHDIAFDEPLDLLFHRDQTLPLHPNGMRFTALDAEGGVLHRDEFYSTGGGFVVRGAEFGREPDAGKDIRVRFPFESGADLLRICREHGLEMHEVVLANEATFRSEAETRAALFAIWSVMNDCIERGLKGTGLLPGVLKVRRRAARLHRMLIEAAGSQPLQVMLPRIRGNIGAEGNFTLREPVHTRVSVQGAGLAGNLPGLATQTLTFVPKCVGVCVVLLVGGAWMMQTSVAFTTDLFARIPELLG